jgi:hypothetical protein
MCVVVPKESTKGLNAPKESTKILNVPRTSAASRVHSIAASCSALLALSGIRPMSLRGMFRGRFNVTLKGLAFHSKAMNLHLIFAFLLFPTYVSCVRIRAILCTTSNNGLVQNMNTLPLYA